jgi:Putative DNA-binding domain
MNYREFENWIKSAVEDQHLDFKIGCAESKNQDIAKDIAAFANATGGTLVYGVSNNRELKGCDDFIVSKWQSMSEEHLENAVRDKCRGYWTHAVTFNLEIIEHEQKRFFKLDVPTAGLLTGFRKNKNDAMSPQQYWKRVGKQQVPMTHLEIVNAAENEQERTHRLTMEKTFSKHLVKSFAMLRNQIYWAYGYGASNGKSLPKQLDLSEAPNLQANGLPALVVSAESVFDQIKGLSFLGLNLDNVLKEIVLLLHHELGEICKKHSIWRLDPKNLENLKNGWLDGNQNCEHPMLIYLNCSNRILLIINGLKVIAEDSK